jgi:hypothetical protein
MSYNRNGFKEARSSNRPHIDCKITRINGICTTVDLNDRPNYFSSLSLSAST